MQAKIKTYFYADEPKVIYGPDVSFGLMFECEVIDPPSMTGRTVYLHIEQAMVVPVMTTLRREAVRQRQQTIAESEAKMKGS